MIFVDTSFIIAWLNTRDQLHHKALEMRDKYLSEDWLTTDCVLLEVGNAFSRHYRAKAIEAIENILTDEKAIVVGLDADLFNRAFEMFKQGDDKTWGLIDCVSFVVMKDRDCTLALTNDQHFNQAGFKALMRS